MDCYLCVMENFRYAIELAYRGTDYHGWQIQPNAPSVQEEIEKRLTQLAGNHPIAVVGCGRTDTGVHASYYVLHMDIDRAIDCESWKYKLSKMLPDAISVASIQPVSAEFHARFTAISRTYHYFIHQEKNPFLLDSWHYPHDLDLTAMNEAASYLLGTKDFTSFSKLHTDVKTNICTVTKAQWKVFDSNRLRFEVQADRFLRNMVRAVVGTLIEVGEHKLTPSAIPEILEAKTRSAAKLSVPAHGLFLVDVAYPIDLFRKTKG